MESAEEQAPTISLDSIGRDPSSAIAAFLTGKEMCGVACLCDAWRWVGRDQRADKAWERHHFRRLHAYSFLRGKPAGIQLTRRLRAKHCDDDIAVCIATDTIFSLTVEEGEDGLASSFSFARWLRCCSSGMSYIRQGCACAVGYMYGRSLYYRLTPSTFWLDSRLFPRALRVDVMMQLVTMMEDRSFLVAAEARGWLREFEFKQDGPEERTGIRGAEPFPEEVKRAMLLIDDRIEAANAARFAADQLQVLQRISEGTAELRFGAGGYYVSLRPGMEVRSRLGRVIAVADECAWDYRDLHFAEGPRGRYCEPSPPRDPQRAHIRRWLAGEVSEDDSEDY